ncbi:hypothetical protein Q604_UNBC06376G0001, partial [human gut metagenome]
PPGTPSGYPPNGWADGAAQAAASAHLRAWLTGGGRCYGSVLYDEPGARTQVAQEFVSVAGGRIGP